MTVLDQCRSLPDLAQLIAGYLQERVTDPAVGKLLTVQGVPAPVLLPLFQGRQFAILGAYAANGDARRAAVYGFVTPEGLDRVRTMQNIQPRLRLVVYRPRWGRRAPHPVAVRRDAIDLLPMASVACVGLGGIRRMFGDAHLDLSRSLVGQSQVIAYDPVWGRNDVLWPALQRVFE